jgi:hypothetical protein
VVFSISSGKIPVQDSKLILNYETTSSIHILLRPLNTVVTSFDDTYQSCTLLGYGTALSRSYVPTFRDNVSVPTFKVQEGADDRLSRDVGT